MDSALISSNAGVLCALSAIAAGWFFVAKVTGSKFFHIVPPILLIYSTPVLLSNTGIIPSSSPVYEQMGDLALPLFMALLLIGMDIRSVTKVLGRGVAVMLCGTLGVVVGGAVSYFCVSHWLDEGAWRGFGALSASWIGGSQNMAAVGEALETSPAHFGLAIVADNVIYLWWIPLMLQSREYSEAFNRFTRAKTSMPALNAADVADSPPKRNVVMTDILFLLALGFATVYVAKLGAAAIPEAPPILTQKTNEVLIVTTIGILISFTPARRIPGSHDIAMAMAYLFIAQMGARAALDGLSSQAVPFIAAAFIWIVIHGAFILASARIFRVDVSTAAISSAANIGGVASAPIVAAHHDGRLVPAAILMGLLGNAIGNYAAFLTAWLCSLIAP